MRGGREMRVKDGCGTMYEDVFISSSSSRAEPARIFARSSRSKGGMMRISLPDLQ
jgi:hypothetical protein